MAEATSGDDRLRAIAPIGARLLVVAVVVARLAHVWEYRAGYFAAPLEVLDLGDGGWDAQVGIVAAWLLALAEATKRPRLRAPLFGMLAAATGIWIAASIAIALVRAPAAATKIHAGDATAALATFRGKPTVVNLWATWCAPCVHELPLLQRAQAEHTDLHVVFLNQGESAERVQGFLAARRLALHNVVLDPTGRVAAALGAGGALPTTFFLDADGRVLASNVGALSADVLSARLRLLAGPRGAAQGAISDERIASTASFSFAAASSRH